MKRSTVLLRRVVVLAAGAATLVTVAAGASSAGTRVTEPTAAPKASTVQAVHTNIVRPNQINQFCQYTNAEPQIGFGSRGVAVQQAQCELDSVDNGPIDLPSDGIFGQMTKDWTEQFQGCAGLKQDGIIGPLTWHALDQWSAVARSCG